MCILHDFHLYLYLHACKFTCPHPYLCVHPPCAQRGSWNTIPVRQLSLYFSLYLSLYLFSICPTKYNSSYTMGVWPVFQIILKILNLKNLKHLFPYFYKHNYKYSKDFPNMWKGSQEKTNHCPDIFVNWKNMWITHPSISPFSSKDLKCTNTNIQIYNKYTNIFQLNNCVYDQPISSLSPAGKALELCICNKTSSQSSEMR